jgi:hypothetical protein
MSERACEECHQPLPSEAHARTRLHKECVDERRRKRQRTGTQPRDCSVCGSLIENPYKGDQKFCDSPACKATATRNRQHKNAGVHLPSDEPAKDEQMERLFRYYKSRESIVYDRDMDDGTRILVVPDLQFPFVDEPLLAAFLRFVQDWKPHITVDVGDMLDAYELSDFDKRPSRLFNLDDEMAMASDFINDVRRRSAVDNLYFHVDGNHEERMQRIIWRHAQQFSFMVKDIPEAMGLDKLTSGFVPYGKHVELQGFVITHGTIVRQHSAYTAKAMMDKYRSSGASGHTHRMGDHSITDHKDVSHTWYEVGCLCRRDLEYVKASANWQQGFMVATVYRNALHPHLVRVIETDKGRGFVVHGSYYHIDDSQEQWKAA